MPAPCPSSELLQALLANELSEAEQASVAEHLGICPPCRRRLDEMSGGTDWLPANHPSPPLADTGSSPCLLAAMDRLRVLGQEAGLTPPSDANVARLDFLTPSDQPGTLGRFGPYEIIEEIARGAMGIVLKARDPALARIVAIKVLAPALATNPAARTRFVREARAAAAISHEHVVDIHAVDEANGLPYLVMQFISGQSLRERIRATGPLGLEEILRIGTQVAAGLAAAHAQGLIHRDIKPANILLENGVERVRITDFGLARTADEISSAEHGWLAGTPEFMAPEQARGEPVDHRADLFSLGCVLYFMATGEPPFVGSTLLSVIRKLSEEEPRPLPELNPALPKWLGAIVTLLLAKDPAQRPPSAQAVAEMLQNHLAALQQAGSRSASERHGDLAVADHGLGHRRHSRSLWLAASLVGAALVLLALHLVRLATRPREAATTAPVFHLLAANGTAAPALSNLAQAVEAARAGDTIEVRVNGKIDTQPVALGQKALTIRAAAGFRPVLVSRSGTKPLVTTEALLVLEGLEFHMKDWSASPAARPELERRWRGVVHSRGAPLFLANCRFDVSLRDPSRLACGVFAVNSPHAELRNCEFYAQGGCGAAWRYDNAPRGSDAPAAAVRLGMANCVQRSDIALHLDPRTSARAVVTLVRNTLAARVILTLATSAAPSGLRLFAGTNIFDARVFLQTGLREGAGDLKALLDWQENHNLHAVADSLIDPRFGFGEAKPPSLPAWNRFWTQTNRGSVELPLRLAASLRRVPVPALTPRHFQLTAAQWDLIQTAGGTRAIAYGATVELVGPGQAYDRWRRSPEHQQWQERIRQFHR
jgi:serine/threonine protein kinase